MKLKVASKHYGLTELYDTIAGAMGHHDTTQLNYDCRKINVAPNIQEGFFAHYKATMPGMSETDLKMNVCMMLLNYGPKTDEELEENEVEIFDGFIHLGSGSYV